MAHLYLRSDLTGRHLGFNPDGATLETAEHVGDGQVLATTGRLARNNFSYRGGLCFAENPDS